MKRLAGFVEAVNAHVAIDDERDVAAGLVPRVDGALAIDANAAAVAYRQDQHWTSVGGLARAGFRQPVVLLDGLECAARHQLDVGGFDHAVAERADNGLDL